MPSSTPAVPDVSSAAPSAGVGQPARRRRGGRGRATGDGGTPRRGNDPRSNRSQASNPQSATQQPTNPNRNAKKRAAQDGQHGQQTGHRQSNRQQADRQHTGRQQTEVLPEHTSTEAPQLASFEEAGVPAVLADVLRERDITVPSPIQALTLPDSLAGRDVLGRGRTGSGKTYAFLLPLVTRLAGMTGNTNTADTHADTNMADTRGAAPAPAHRGARGRKPRALILAPTRELALQLAEALAPLERAAGLVSTTIFGGVSQNPQVRALQAGVDILVACPGRLEDLIGQGHAHLDRIEVTVLDEADHMADLGFLPAVRRLLDRTPKDGQRMLFSATLDNGIRELVKRYLHDPVTHQADSAQSPVSTMDHHVLAVSADDHLPVLVGLTAAPGRRVVFTRTKHRAKKLAKQLNAEGVPAVELHGNLSQNARVRTMDAFHSGKVATLVATDIAARGIHVDDIEMVIHSDPPIEHKAYLHRSGRTARAGASGTVVTLMTPDQRGDVRDLMRKAGIKPTVTQTTPETGLLTELAPGERAFVAPENSPVPRAQPTQQRGPKKQASGGSRGGARTGSGGTATGGSRPSGERSRGRRPGGPAAGNATDHRGAQASRGRTARTRNSNARTTAGSASRSPQGPNVAWSTSSGGSSGGAARFSQGGGGRRGR